MVRGGSGLDVAGCHILIVSGGSWLSFAVAGGAQGIACFRFEALQVQRLTVLMSALETGQWLKRVMAVAHYVRICEAAE